MSVDPAILFRRVEEIVIHASTAEGAWGEVISVVNAGGARVPETISEHDVGSDAAAIGMQLAGVLSREPPPSSLTFYHFGLFDA